MLGSLATRVRVRVCHDDARDDGDESRRLGVSASGLRGCNAVATGPLAHLEAPSRQSSSKAAPRQAVACSTTLTRAPEVNPQSRSLVRCHGRAEQLSGPAAIAAARFRAHVPSSTGGWATEEFAALIAGTIGRRAWPAPSRSRKSHDDENALCCFGDFSETRCGRAGLTGSVAVKRQVAVLAPVRRAPRRRPPSAGAPTPPAGVVRRRYPATVPRDPRLPSRWRRSRTTRPPSRAVRN